MDEFESALEDIKKHCCYDSINTLETLVKKEKGVYVENNLFGLKTVRCPQCTNIFVNRGDRYCSKCGHRLLWKI